MSPAAHDDGPWAWVFTPRRPNEKRYWLVKSEPNVFSFDDLRAAPKQTTQWDGVRNFAARNFLRDGMKRGDQVFFYHSSTNPQASARTAGRWWAWRGLRARRIPIRRRSTRSIPPSTRSPIRRTRAGTRSTSR